MLDLKLIRSDPERVKAALARRGAAGQVDELLALDARRRELLPEVENVQAERRTLSKQIGEAKQAGGDVGGLMERVQGLKEKVEARKAELEEVEADLDRVAASLPNLPDPDAPDGMTEEDAVVIREVGERPEFDFEPRDHLEIGAGLGLIEMEAAARLSGSRFAYLKGDLVLLELALVRFAIELVRAEGHEPVVPPVLVREEALVGTGFLPGDRDQIYEVPRDELFLVGTSEVALAGLHAGQILDPGALPLRYAGFSTCFRREAGAAGRDTRGIFRVHQFDKVEMFSFVEPTESAAEHERLLAIEERILTELEIPYRVVNVAAGDLGAPAAKKYDCEAWIPSQGRYRELTSCSNTTDYQARRLSCRYRSADGESPQAVHTLNGTAVAVGRTMIALIENRQERDGGFTLPNILHLYGAPERIGPL
ncbi:MAG TPA: serine--tRNA ligase, partial [Solirubrobacterales bacterium]|jgi:seryl-tRNA synthetase|nr:serine--tRNA ligase [Solirubrobacterales bacterium]